jgi:hypothetical protein
MMYALPAGLAAHVRLMQQMAAPLRAAEQARQLAATFAPLAAMARKATTAARERRHAKQGRRAAARQSRPRGGRTAASASTSGSDPGDPTHSPEPPRLRLRRHPRFGLCSPAMLRLLLREQAVEAQR